MGLLGIGYAVSHDLRAAVCILASAILVSVGRRTVGGLWGDDLHVWKVPHLLACIFWSVMVGLAALLGTAPWWGAIAVGVGAAIGHTALGLWGSAGMGHYGDRNEMWKFWGFGSWVSQVDGKVHRAPGALLSYMGLSGYGTFIVAAAVALTFCPDAHGVWWIELLAGLSLAPIYCLTWLIFYRRAVGWPHGWEPPLALAEWMYGILGALVCLGFIAA